MYYKYLTIIFLLLLLIPLATSTPLQGLILDVEFANPTLPPEVNKTVVIKSHVSIYGTEWGADSSLTISLRIELPSVIVVSTKWIREIRTRLQFSVTGFKVDPYVGISYVIPSVELIDTKSRKIIAIITLDKPLLKVSGRQLEVIKPTERNVTIVFLTEALKELFKGKDHVDVRLGLRPRILSYVGSVTLTNAIDDSPPIKLVLSNYLRTVKLTLTRIIYVNKYVTITRRTTTTITQQAIVLSKKIVPTYETRTLTIYKTLIKPITKTIIKYKTLIRPTIRTITSTSTKVYTIKSYVTTKITMKRIYTLVSTVTMAITKNIGTPKNTPFPFTGISLIYLAAIAVLFLGIGIIVGVKVR